MPRATIPKGYARLIAHGWDSWQEAVNWSYGPELDAVLKERRATAEAMDEAEGQAVPLEFGGETVMVAPHGAKGGFRYVLATDDFLLMIGSTKKQWTVTVRYLAAGLWEHGIAALQARVYVMLAATGELAGDDPNDFVRITRADFAFDFYSPAFTVEMRPALFDQIVAHSSVKSKGHGNTTAETEHRDGAFYVRGGRIQTLTIGAKNGLQVEVYDKGREIVEASGKEWMIRRWGDGDWLHEGRVSNVWRLEIRMGGDFLKERNCRSTPSVLAYRPMLIGEALHTRRLTARSGTDKNRRRWPLHPLWQLAHDQAGADELLPLGRLVTGRRAALVGQGIKQIAGTVISLSQLAAGSFDEVQIRDMLNKALDRARDDQHLQHKLEKARYRYAAVDEAA